MDEPLAVTPEHVPEDHKSIELPDVDVRVPNSDSAASAATTVQVVAVEAPKQDEEWPHVQFFADLHASTICGGLYAFRGVLLGLLPFMQNIFTYAFFKPTEVITGCVNPYNQTQSFTLSECVACNGNVASIVITSRDSLYIPVTGFFILVIEFILLSFRSRFEMAAVLFEYGVSTSGKNHRAPYYMSGFVGVLFLIYGLIARQIQVNDVSSSASACKILPSFISLVGNQTLMITPTISGSNSDGPIMFLKSSLPFLLICQTAFMYIITHSLNAYADVDFKLLVRNPYLIVKLREHWRFHAMESDVVEAVDAAAEELKQKEDVSLLDRFNLKFRGMVCRMDSELVLRNLKSKNQLKPISYEPAEIK